MRTVAIPSLVVVLLLLLVTSVPAVEPESPKGDRVESFTISGAQRRALIHLPPGAGLAAKIPLVIALHGHGGTAAKMRRLSGLNAVADAKGFMVAYPEGTSWRNIPWRSWNAGNCCGYGQETAVDDVAFLRELIDRLRADASIDPGRVYVIGVSNGGMMAYRAACELADRIAAIAPVAGAMGAPDCQPAAPVAVMIIHGTADRKVPYAGGKGIDNVGDRIDRSVEDAAAFWNRHNDGAAEVMVHTIPGGIHEWPDNAAETIWEFFSRQAKPAGSP